MQKQIQVFQIDFGEEGQEHMKESEKEGGKEANYVRGTSGIYHTISDEPAYKNFSSSEDCPMLGLSKLD